MDVPVSRSTSRPMTHDVWLASTMDKLAEVENLRKSLGEPTPRLSRGPPRLSDGAYRMRRDVVTPERSTDDADAENASVKLHLSGRPSRRRVQIVEGPRSLSPAEVRYSNCQPFSILKRCSLCLAASPDHPDVEPDVSAPRVSTVLDLSPLNANETHGSTPNPSRRCFPDPTCLERRSVGFTGHTDRPTVAATTQLNMPVASRRSLFSAPPSKAFVDQFSGAGAAAPSLTRSNEEEDAHSSRSEAWVIRMSKPARRRPRPEHHTRVLHHADDQHVISVLKAFKEFRTPHLSPVDLDRFLELQGVDPSGQTRLEKVMRCDAVLKLCGLL